MVEVYSFRAFSMTSGAFMVSGNMAPLSVIERIRTAEVVQGSMRYVSALFLDGNSMIRRDHPALRANLELA